MTLTADITRCHDASCQGRKRCLRWLERESGNSHAASHRTDGGYCLSFIHAGPPESTIPLLPGITPEQADVYRRGYLQGWLEGWNACAAQPPGDEDDAA